LGQSEALLQAICEGSPDLIFIKDQDRRFVLANPAALRVLGKPAEAVLGRTLEEIFENAPAWRAISEGECRIIETGRAEVVEQTLETPEGRQVLLLTCTPRRDPAGRVIGLVGIAHNITQRKRLEEALSQSAASLETVQRVAHLGNWEFSVTSLQPLALDPLIWSDEVFRILGYDAGQTEASNENFFRAAHPQDRERLKAALLEGLSHGRPWQLDYRILWPDGTDRVVHHRGELVCDETGRPVKIVGTLQDITERKQSEETRQRLETQLRQSQKMEAIGQLAGGIAHDFNNLLTIVLGNAELLAQDPSLTPERQDLTRQISGAARRAADLTRQLLAFSRRQVMQMRRLDLNEVLANVYKMLYRLLGEHIALQCRYASELPPVEADTGMLEQVIMNLAINARDAMAAGGRLTIATHVSQFDRAAAGRNPEAREGRFVSLTVTDTGCGMDTATLARVFEPFFTTKGIGKGTGLGLATVYGIVKQHNGWVEVSSKVGVGSTFKIFLPAVQAEPAGAAKADAPHTPSKGGHETVLLTEDEPAVRLLACACLQQLGYRVFEAANGPEALRVWGKHESEINLLLTDLVMPEGMNGHELACRLLHAKPNLKVLYSSGFGRNAFGPNSPLLPTDHFLPKPYEFAALADAVRRCLDS
jgi:PAS domain S-box-containing protein